VENRARSQEHRAGREMEPSSNLIQAVFKVVAQALTGWFWRLFELE
jgi:hypothetical protein